ncbi:septation protein SepH [Thermopolyspora sp. NPDC052614]|uniref:septation protein SepH n=1 Tax=Thermopolyspora sp. NPDC052614 TaxID=3155682 RepID=UPI00342C536B
MQELRLVAVSEDGTYLVLATAGRGTRFTLPVDDRLRAAVRGNFSRLGQYEIEVESPLRPKEIQARIRAGETAEEIAATAGIPVERVRWFEGPVLQEREYMAQQAQRIAVRMPGEAGGPRPTLGELVIERLTRRGVPTDEIDWDSCKRDDGLWRVKLGYVWNGHTRHAEWLFDPRRRHITPHDDEAMRLSAAEYVEPVEDTTVTPFVPRLAAKLAPVPAINDLPPQFTPLRSDAPGDPATPPPLPPVPVDPDSDLITADSIRPPLDRRPPSPREPLGLPAAFLGDDRALPADPAHRADPRPPASFAPETATPTDAPASGRGFEPSAPDLSASPEPDQAVRPVVAARPASEPAETGLPAQEPATAARPAFESPASEASAAEPSIEPATPESPHVASPIAETLPTDPTGPAKASAPARPASEPATSLGSTTESTPGHSPAKPSAPDPSASEPGTAQPTPTPTPSAPAPSAPAPSAPAAETPASGTPVSGTPVPPRPAPPVPAPSPSPKPDLVVPEPRVVEPPVNDPQPAKPAAEPIVAKVPAPPVARKPLPATPPTKAPAEPVAVPAARTSEDGADAAPKPEPPIEDPATEQAADPAPQPVPPQPAPPPQPVKPAKAPRSRKGSRSRRASVPTWDEIMFGARRQD